MIKKHKSTIIFFTLLFLLYFSLGIIFTYKLNSLDKLNLFFGSDSNRVFLDLTMRVGDHYRTSVHPIFIILFNPVIKILSIIIRNNVIATIFFQAILNSLSIIIVYKMIKKINGNGMISLLLTLIMSLSFSQLLFVSTIETYTFAQLFLVLLISYFYKIANKNLETKDFVLIIILGIFSLGITITNFFSYIIVVLFLTILKKEAKRKNELFNFIILIIIPISLCVVLSEIQAVIFPNSRLFLYQNLNSILYNTHEELSYVEPFGIKSIINQIKTVFVYSFIMPNINLTTVEGYKVLEFGAIHTIQKFLIIISLTSILICLIKFIKNNYNKIKKNNTLIVLAIIFTFNFVLHLFYGNSEGILYTLHYQYILILILAYLLKNKNTKKTVMSLIIILTFIIVSNITGLYKMYNLISSLSVSQVYPSIIYIIYTIIIIFLITILLNKNKLKYIISIIIFCLCVSAIYYKNNVSKEITKYELYLQQMKMLKKNTNYETISKKNESIYFFGMGNRRKILYRQGKLYDLDSKNIIYNFDVKKEYIIPNEYMVLIETNDNKNIKIFENDSGIYLKVDNKAVEIIDETEKLSLPQFEGYKYSEILKVLHQEILFNIRNSEIIPNILVYKEAWYRDAMMAAMVLEKTDNIYLLKPWIDRIDKIYDEQNGRKETDNIGELLYLLYSTKSDNDIKTEILKEIKILTKKQNYISGFTDAQMMSYYPTVLAKFALEKLNIENNLILPIDNDVYARLVWFYDSNRDKKGYINGYNSPYLNWASYHTTLDNVNQDLYLYNNIYPLSYEQNATYADYNNMPELLNDYNYKKVSPTHVWAASEIFLLLYEYK